MVLNLFNLLYFVDFEKLWIAFLHSFALPGSDGPEAKQKCLN